ncbi:LysE family translocator [Enterovibrio norvegicus]|uniref:LysE family translocator n=1 Tax=Enterovibrio norvegicus TaxID=188144 RepID=UPI001F534AD9|nr:LysE family translocator [Enterovibrio norvegicus]
MMQWDTFFLYATVSFFYITSPGPAILLAIRNGLTGKLTVVAISSLANIIGLFVLSAVSMLGLGALLSTSSVLFTLFKAVGACYLIYLGIKIIASSNRNPLEKGIEPKSTKTYRAYFFESLLLSVTNPKPIIFFASFFPQFLNTEVAIAPQFFIMTITFMTMSFGSLMFYGATAHALKKTLSKNVVSLWFNRITGGIFVGLGAKLALTQRM